MLIAAAVVVGVLVLAYVLLTVIIGHTYSVPSESMVPSYPVGSHVWATRFGSADRGQVVIVRNPNPNPSPNSNGPAEVIRRIVAVEGDTISAVDGRFMLNGAPADEPYAQGPTIVDRPVTVPKGAVFLLGDNRAVSFDSRQYGPVSTSEIIGYVRFSWGG